MTTITEGYRVPSHLLTAGDRVFAAIGAPELIIEKIGDPSDTGFRSAEVILHGRHTTVSIPNTQYLVASAEERDDILARESR